MIYAQDSASLGKKVEMHSLIGPPVLYRALKTCELNSCNFYLFPRITMHLHLKWYHVKDIFLQELFQLFNARDYTIIIIRFSL